MTIVPSLHVKEATIQSPMQQEPMVTVRERSHLLRQLQAHQLSQNKVIQLIELHNQGLIPFPSYENVQARAQLYINSICTNHSPTTTYLL